MAAPDTSRTVQARKYDAPHPARPRLLDLFCGQGGASMGYYRAGFDVVGVDRAPQPRYPFAFVQADAIEYVTAHARDYHAIHASPPCQRYSRLASLWPDRDHPDLIGPTRAALAATGLPYVIENVPGAPLIDPVLLCGSMFDPPLDVRRHRLFEANWPLRYTDWPCRHRLWDYRYVTHDRRRRPGVRSRVIGVYGHGAQTVGGGREAKAAAMEMPWADDAGLSEAIPPRYTQFIGAQLLPVAAARRVAGHDGRTADFVTHLTDTPSRKDAPMPLNADDAATTETDVAYDVLAALDMYAGLCGSEDTTIVDVTNSGEDARTVTVTLSNGDRYALRVRYSGHVPPADAARREGVA